MMNTTANFFRKGEKRMGITAYLPVYWLIALVVFLVIEAATLGLATIWFAGGALVALIAAMCGAGIVIQIVLFLVVSLVLLFFTRPFAVRFLNKDTLKTNVDRVVGMEGVVTEEISNLAGTGKVSLGGNIWTARTLPANYADFSHAMMPAENGGYFLRVASPDLRRADDTRVRTVRDVIIEVDASGEVVDEWRYIQGLTAACLVVEVHGDRAASEGAVVDRNRAVRVGVDGGVIRHKVAAGQSDVVHAARAADVDALDILFALDCLAVAIGQVDSHGFIRSALTPDTKVVQFVGGDGDILGERFAIGGILCTGFAAELVGINLKVALAAGNIGVVAVDGDVVSNMAVRHGADVRIRTADDLDVARVLLVGRCQSVGQRRDVAALLASCPINRVVFRPCGLIDEFESVVFGGKLIHRRDQIRVLACANSGNNGRALGQGFNLFRALHFDGVRDSRLGRVCCVYCVGRGNHADQHGQGQQQR